MGAVNIDNTGSGSAVTLSSDGTSLLLNGSAVGGGGSSTLTIQNKTAAYTVVASDNGTIINCTSGTFTVSLTAAATLGAGFNCWVWNTGTLITAAVTIDPTGSETIDGKDTLLLRRGEGVQIVCDGTNWQTGDKKAMRCYAENGEATSTRPVATGGDSVAIGASASASEAQAVALGRATASGPYSFAAAGHLSLATASSTYAVAIGSNSAGGGAQAVTGSGAMALGGSYASGSNSFAAAVANNTSSYGATGTNAVAIGYLAKATATEAFAFGYSCTSSGNDSFSAGYNSNATGKFTVAVGTSDATIDYAVALGQGAVSSVQGKFALASGYAGTKGLYQSGILILRKATTDGTSTVINSGDGSAGATNQVILPNNSAYAFTGTVVARQSAAGGTASAAWKVEGLIRREGSAGTTTLVASTVTAISNAPGWTLALSADTTNGGLAVTATGAAATNIRWVATIQTSEVTYA